MIDDEEHLDPQTLVLLQEGSLGAEAADRARAHLDRCGTCQAEASVAQSFLRTPSDPVAPEIEQRLRRRVMASARASHGRPARRTRAMPAMPRWAVGGVLAACAAVIAVGIWQTRPDGPEPLGQNNLRGTRPEATWHLQVVAVRDGWEASWQAQPRAEEYLVRIQNTSGQTAWSRSVRGTTLRLDAEELQTPLPATEPYFVSVLYVDQGTEQVSPPVRLPRRL